MTTRYRTLVREFFGQFFASETVTSDHALRTAIIGVVAFLITPGFLLPIQLAGPFEFAAIRFPALLEPMIRLLATLFITYSIVSMGVVAAYTWDVLGFDRRDAMVLGPLPISGAAIVSAKLSALAILLLSGAALLNIMTAVPFAMVASNHTGMVASMRHFVAHMVTTMAAATAVFCLLVTLRTLVGMIGSRREAITSLVQFVLVSAVLCFIVVAPTALQIARGPGRRGTLRAVMVPIPAWSPTTWFLGLYETIRGSSGSELWPNATIAGYRRQTQLALAPSASAASQSSARLRRALARLIAGRDRIARATADFVVTTIARNRAPQAPIAINTAIGLAMVVAALARGGGVQALMHPRTIVLWIPLALAYWAAIGLRASFFVPSELPAAWMFQANAPGRSRAYWSAVRASLVALLVPPVAAIALALGPLVSWRVAVWHGLFVTAIVILLAEMIALTIDYVPFTRAYPPGHAKLKSRWPIYFFGLFVFAVFPVRFELRRLADPAAMLQTIGWIAAAIAALELYGRRRALTWSVMAPEEEISDGLSSMTVLSIATAGHT
jgi:hypothetical protein